MARHHDIIDDIEADVNNSAAQLTSWETDFLESISKRDELTLKQEEVLSKIARTCMIDSDKFV